jgi:hypothetical protein
MANVMVIAKVSITAFNEKDWNKTKALLIVPRRSL